MSDWEGNQLKFTAEDDRVNDKIKKLETALGNIRELADQAIDMLDENPQPTQTIDNILEEIKKETE